ncbi:RagB/SusD family nutrient uptake outer membrane protein [Polaribacter sargassicola]|uniref:RagB/SusD family nutrient uptake outer membrane protein n=1 Tax=Polaribacter sargassicola TaxID=2836891 RepID=UPI001F3ECDAD|nr:RagB/SusD family nutrient uptake outer membrane protein [Polaribacter sp. DS7-9]MCG1037309.1 RagB/SusD family nutrient uptake outer membrane protein [Polaribacter sp. DS7-9]
MLLFIFVTFSCDSYLEEVPQNKLKPSTVTDYRELLNFGYITDKRIMPYIEALGDDVGFFEEDKMAGLNSGTTVPDAGDLYISAYMYDLSHEESLGSDVAFSNFYQSIYYANLVINNIENSLSVIITDDMQEYKDNYKGEAYALRAFSYFYLVNLYGQHFDPATASTDFGVPIITDTNTEDKAYPRSTVKEVYDMIKADLEEAVSLMEANPINKTNKLLFNLQNTLALQSRVALYMQEWDSTIETATKLLDSNSSVFNLSNLGYLYNLSNDYNFDIFRYGTDYLDISNDNVIFCSGATENIPILSIWPTATTFSVSKDLADIYEEGDIRRYYFIGTHERVLYGVTSSKLSLIKNKENTPIATNAAYRTFQGYSRVLRVEEVLLNRAEAYAQKGELALAINDLNTIRVKKFDPNYYEDLIEANFTQETLINYIYDERRRELCFEGQRWFDLKRTTRPEMFRVGYNGREAHILKDDPRYVLQIPEDELSVNPNIVAAPR